MHREGEMDSIVAGIDAARDKRHSARAERFGTRVLSAATAPNSRTEKDAMLTERSYLNSLFFIELKLKYRHTK